VAVTPSPPKLTDSGTAVVPCINCTVEVVIVAASIAVEKTTVGCTVIAIPVAPTAGVWELTVGSGPWARVGNAVVKLMPITNVNATKILTIFVFNLYPLFPLRPFKFEK
jgi:hypothetical protein